MEPSLGFTNKTCDVFVVFNRSLVALKDTLSTTFPHGPTARTCRGPLHGGMVGRAAGSTLNASVANIVISQISNNGRAVVGNPLSDRDVVAIVNCMQRIFYELRRCVALRRTSVNT